MTHEQLPTFLRRVQEFVSAYHADSPNDGALLRAFAAANDQAAFTTLVRRHGALVLAVCRRVLHDLHDAEDAFQATFILLARNAAAVGKHESAAGWLHETAFRTASNARRALVRRKKHERSAPTMRGTSPEWDVVWREVQVILDEEIQRLPASYREAFVLCCLENKSAAEAARVLGVQEGTVGSRLTRARARLREALTRRGVSLSAVQGVAALTGGMTAARASAALVASTVRAAALLAAKHTTAAGVVSANVAQLLTKAETGMIAAKLKTTALVVLVLALAGAGVGAYQQTAEPPPEQGSIAAVREQPASVPPAARQSKPAAEIVEVRGRVLGPDGKPVAGAKLFRALAAPRTGPWPKPSYAAASGADGRFRFTVPRSELDEGSGERSPSQVMAVADGYGCDWSQLGPEDKEITLRLVKDMPVRGRILDPEGKPVAGAKLSVWGVAAPKGDDLGYILESVRKGNYGYDYPKSWRGPVPGQPVRTTDADGRFQFAGLGRERGVILRLEGPGIATMLLEVLTRPFQTITGPAQWRKPGRSIHGASFDHMAASSRLIRGVVRDKATGKPLAGVSVRGDVLPPWCEAVTDQQGRYELRGLAKAPRYSIVVKPAPRQLYLACRARLDDAPGFGTLTRDFDLVAGGVTVRGKVTDKATGKPIAHARVEYYPLFPNPNVIKLGLLEPRSEAATGPDGSYTLTALPGIGVLGATGPKPEVYAPARLTLQEQKDFFKKGSAPPRMQENFLSVAAGGDAAMGLYQAKFNALTLLELDTTEKALVKDLTLEPARTLKGRVVGPDGQPITGTVVFGLGGNGLSRYRAVTLQGAEFTIQGINPRETRWLAFYHPDKDLGFFLKELRGDTLEPLIIKLQPCGSASGRILYPDGQPVAGLRLEFQGSQGRGGNLQTTTDKEGRFRVAALVPGQEYAIVPTGYAPFPLAQVIVEPGKHKDLGDIKAQLNK
jgi:RNA polymerase sigma factor (sigma-70 family)